MSKHNVKMTNEEMAKLFPVQYHTNSQRTHCIRYPRFDFGFIIWDARFSRGDGSLSYFVYFDEKGEIHTDPVDSRHMPREKWNQRIPLEILMPYIVKNKNMITEKLKEIGFW